MTAPLTQGNDMADNWKKAPKDPQDVRDYGVNWAADLPTGATITASAWTIVSGDVSIVEDDIPVPATGVVVRLGGGTVALSPSVLNNHITLSTGEELDLDIALPIKERVIV